MCEILCVSVCGGGGCECVKRVGGLREKGGRAKR